MDLRTNLSMYYLYFPLDPPPPFSQANILFIFLLTYDLWDNHKLVLLSHTSSPIQQIIALLKNLKELKKMTQ